MARTDRRRQAGFIESRTGVARWLGVCVFATALLRCACLPALAQERPDVLTGGVGADERAEVQAQRAGYNLRLAFANDRGEYLAGVAVHIDAQRDGQTQRVYEAEFVGPLFYARLTPGQYRLELVYRDVSRVIERRVGAKQKPTEIVVRWPATD